MFIPFERKKYIYFFQIRREKSNESDFNHKDFTLKNKLSIFDIEANAVLYYIIYCVRAYVCASVCASMCYSPN